MTVEAEVRIQLQAFLRRLYDPSVGPVVKKLERMAGGGRSRENWVLDLSWPAHSPDGAGDEELILRRDPVGGLVETDRATEYRLLQALQGSAVPAPAARWLDADGECFSRPTLIMERMPGSSDYHVLNGDLPLEQRLSLARDMCRLLGRVHAFDWESAGLGDALPDPGEQAARAELERWEKVLRRDQVEAYPEIDLAVLWLRERAPTAPERVLVHSDFKPGNVLLDQSGITALLDWELAHIGDPMEDLGWMVQPLRQREHLIARHWQRNELIGSYEHETGRAVDVGSVDWWSAFATLRTAIMQVSGLRSYLDGRSSEPYRPTRKVLRALLDLTED